MKPFAHGMRLYVLAAITAAILLAGCSRALRFAAPPSPPVAMSPGAEISGELWVTSPSPEPQQAKNDTPGSEALRVNPASRERDDKPVPMPLKHTDVRA